MWLTRWTRCGSLKHGHFLCHLHVLCKDSCFIFSLCRAVLHVWVGSLTMLMHCRRMGNFLPGGGGKPFTQKTLASCPNFYETIEKVRRSYDATT